MIGKIRFLGCLLFTSTLIFGYSSEISAGTGKSLSWCSYLDVGNDNGGNINRMRCIHTSGAATTYCFHYIKWQDGVLTEHPCEKWLWSNLSGQDMERLEYSLGEWNRGALETKPTTLKNKLTGDIAIIHDNETSYDLQQCEKLDGAYSAGVVGPADICWLGEEVAGRK
jgi:hypothetical protein